MTEPEHLTDLGNARRLVLRHGRDLRYCGPLGWHVWTGQRWKPDRTGEVERGAKGTVRSIYREAGLETDEHRRKALASWARTSESESRIRAMIALARTEPEIVIRPEEFDADPSAFNVSNGTIDLRTGDLHPHDRSGLITKLAPVDFDPEVVGDAWPTFLARVLPPEVEAFIRRASGSAMWGRIIDQVFHVLYGTGANGKTTFIEAMRCMFGDYAVATDFSTFLAKRGGDAVRNDLARLRGARFVSAVEPTAGARLAENVVKHVTGGDIITARFLYAEHFEFAPIFTLFLAVNHRPDVRGTDDAIWRRVRLVPFDVTIPEQDRDPHLVERLRDEATAILSWAVRGCLEWQAEGLGQPDAVREATSRYRTDMDPIGRFLAAETVSSDDAFAFSSDLREAYETWCATVGEEPETPKAFGRALSERGFRPAQYGPSRRRGWSGIGLLNGSERIDPETPHEGDALGGSRKEPFRSVHPSGIDGLRDELGAEVSPSSEGPETEEQAALLRVKEIEREREQVERIHDWNESVRERDGEART